MNFIKCAALGEGYFRRIKAKVTGKPIYKSRYNGKRLLNDREANAKIGLYRKMNETRKDGTCEVRAVDMRQSEGSD